MERGVGKKRVIGEGAEHDPVKIAYEVSSPVRSRATIRIPFTIHKSRHLDGQQLFLVFQPRVVFRTICQDYCLFRDPPLTNAGLCS